MPIRIANHAITIVRGNKRYDVKAGEGFELSKEEIQTFNELNPDAFRLPASNRVVVVSPGSSNLNEGETPVLEDVEIENGVDEAQQEAAEASVEEDKQTATGKKGRGSKAADKDGDNL